jgi:predicted DNA-binding ArsR family transcriptional regulator
MSLKKRIYGELQNNRYMTYLEIEELVRSWGYRTSNLERRLRPSESDWVIAVKSEKPPHHIIGYRYVGKEMPKIDIWTQRQQSLNLK